MYKNVYGYVCPLLLLSVQPQYVNRIIFIFWIFFYTYHIRLFNFILFPYGTQMASKYKW